MKKYIISSLLSIVICCTVSAQVNQAYMLYSLGELEGAQRLYEQSVNQSPDISNYFLGEIALKNEDQSAALAYFEKGISADAEAVYCKIGKAKIELKSDTEELEKVLKGIQKKEKKNIDVVLQVAQAFYDSGLKENALTVLSDARKINKSEPLIYIMEGDFLLGENNNKAGEAASQYEMAYGFDSQCVLAYIKYAQLYESSNSTISINTLKSGLESNPDNLLLNKCLGDVYYHHGFYKEAIVAYTKYFEDGTQSLDDMINYAASFYFVEDYDNALKIIQEVLAKVPNNRVMNRLLMYTYEKQQKYDEALVASEKLFTSDGNSSSSFLANDYIVYGDVLRESGDLDQALAQYKKAIELDATKTETLKDVASKMSKAGKYKESGELYKKYIELSEDKETEDYLLMGIAFYQGANSASKSTDEVEKNTVSELVSQAEAAFTTVIDLLPTSYQGYYWRANAKSLLDADLSQGIANSDYEKMIEVILENKSDSNVAKLIEGYRYLSIYHLYQFDIKKSTEDKVKSIDFADKVLELNGQDETALKIKEALAQ